MTSFKLASQAIRITLREVFMGHSRSEITAHAKVALVIYNHHLTWSTLESLPRNTDMI